MAPFVVMTLTGCYSYARVDGAAPPIGAEVSTEITDAGRVALADSLGRAPDKVNGRLVSASDSSITLAVTGVTSLRGEQTKWAGERVTLHRAAFASLTRRQLSMGRTVLAGAIAVGAIVALAFSLGITGGGDGQEGSRNPPPPPGQQ